jgi:hypothetical protein
MSAVSNRQEAGRGAGDRFAGSEQHRLSPADVGAIAAAVAPTVARTVTEHILELLDDRQTAGLVDAVGLADALGVDRSWVYEHADQLGAIRLGTGPRPRLRFELGGALASFRELSAQRRVVPLRGGRQPAVPRPRRSQGGRR